MYYNPDEVCEAMSVTLKKLCEEKHLTLHALAKEAGISTSTISYLMNGKTKPQVYTVLLLCNVLGITMGELFDHWENSVDGECKNNKIIETKPCLSDEEGHFLSCFRGLSDKKKELLRIYVDMLVQYDNELVSKKETIEKKMNK